MDTSKGVRDCGRVEVMTKGQKDPSFVSLVSDVWTLGLWPEQLMEEDPLAMTWKNKRGKNAQVQLHCQR